MPEISGIDNDLDVRIGERQPLENQHRAVRGRVVDEDMFVTIAGAERGDRVSHTLVDFSYIGGLVVARCHHADRLHDCRFCGTVSACVSLRRSSRVMLTTGAISCSAW